MRRLLPLLALLPFSLPAWAGAAAELANQIREAGLDRDECYRVRDVNFTKDDLRLYLTDGHLIFGKPVGGRRVSAVFAADVEAGDAEILLFPPTRSERLALASLTGAPNLNEHFKLAVMVFTDDTCDALLKLIQERGEPRKSAERGVLMEQEWGSVARNLSSSFEIRMVRDLLSSRPPSNGFFYAALSGGRLGNFDVVYDPLAREQITVGKVAFRNERAHFDTWTSFESRPFRKGLRQFPPPDIVVSDFRLDATLQPDLSLKVVTKVKVTPTEKGYRSLAFDLSARMRITQALIDGVPAEVFQRESLRENLIRGRRDDLFLLIPPGELEPGRQYEIEFHHEGEVVAQAGNGVYYVGSRGNWYPNRPTQFAHCDAVFRYPTTLDLVSGGEVVEQRTEGEWRFTRRRTSSPVRFLGFNLGEYRKVSLNRKPYSVEVFANRKLEPALQPQPRQVVAPQHTPSWRRPGPEDLVTLDVEPLPVDPTLRLEGLASEIADAFEFMAEHFGPPPIRNLTVSPIPGAFGQGFPGLVYLSTISYLDPKQRPAAASGGYQQLFFSEILHAHETAHQWWGNIVTSGSYQDDWLMEALANYSALLYLERRKGPDALESVLTEYRRRLLVKSPSGRTTESVGPIIWGVRLDTPDVPWAWRAITYEKGSWIMHMLRRRMGDEKFLGMLGELRRRYEFRTVTTEQFRALAAEFMPPKPADRQLESFFDNWVYATGIPTLQFRHTVRGKAPAWRVAGTLTQSDVATDFGIDVPLEIHLGKGKVETHWLQTDTEPTSFSFTLRQKPVKVVLAPGDSVLAVMK